MRMFLNEVNEVTIHIFLNIENMTPLSYCARFSTDKNSSAEIVYENEAHLLVLNGNKKPKKKKKKKKNNLNIELESLTWSCVPCI